MKRETIAFFLPDLRGGGAEKVAVNLANSFADRGYPVDMVLASACGEFLDDLDTGIRVVDLHATRLRSTVLPLRGYFRREQPQVLVAFMWPLTAIAIVSRWLSRALSRVVVVEHTTWDVSELAKTKVARMILRSSMRLTFPHADVVAAVSRGAADSLANYSGLDGATIRVLYNPVETGRGTLPDNTATPPQGWQSGGKKLLAVGALKPIKDYQTLLLAFSCVRQSTACSLVILGEGACRPALEERIAELGLESVVSMPGFTPDPWPYYRHADLFVLSSRGEGFANVIVEAMAAGTPVVSTDCASGPREILGDGEFGRLVPVGDAVSLARAIREELDSSPDPGVLISRASDFAVDRIADRYLETILPARRVE